MFFNTADPEEAPPSTQEDHSSCSNCGVMSNQQSCITEFYFDKFEKEYFQLERNIF